MIGYINYNIDTSKKNKVKKWFLDLNITFLIVFNKSFDLKKIIIKLILCGFGLRNKSRLSGNYEKTLSLINCIVRL